MLVIVTDKPLINIVKKIYKEAIASILLDREKAKLSLEKMLDMKTPFRLNFFTDVLESVLKKLDYEIKGIRINWEHLRHLRIVDGI